MSHYAKVINNVVKQVIVAEEAAIMSGRFGNPDYWIQTSYNQNMRKNFAAVGSVYDAVRDAFITKKPYPSWKLNETTCLWEAPIPAPEGLAVWDEANNTWKVSE
jgi:hypothetical protein